MMVKRGGKEGQMYLVAAIIFTTILVSVIVISNYSKKNEYKDISSLKDEISIESGKVLDYGINQKLIQPEMNKLLINFTQKYIDSESKDKNLYFIFGDEDNFTLKGYQNNAHDVFLDSAQITSSSGSSGEFLGSINPTGRVVNFNIDENSYVFILKSGENFFFVISRGTRGDEYVVTG